MRYRRKNTYFAILKIVFNIGGITYMWFLVVPKNVTAVECKTISYIAAVAHVIHRSALSAILLWHLYVLKKKENFYFWTNITLFSIRLIFHVSVYIYLFSIFLQLIHLPIIDFFLILIPFWKISHPKFSYQNQKLVTVVSLQAIFAWVYSRQQRSHYWEHLFSIC